jgi:phage terminase large subunit
MIRRPEQLDGMQPANFSASLPVQSEWHQAVARWAANPLDFVLEAIFKITREQWTPWQPGTPRPDQPQRSPERWQGLLLDDVAKAKREGMRRFAVRSGHGTGKSAVQSWLIIWFVLFHRDLKVPVTANTENQLRDVLWAELAKWIRELPPFLKDMVEISTERLWVKADPEGAFAVARTARAEKPEALQGFHASTLGFLIEEASGIPDVIFETASGALSSDHSWVFLFGNPTRTSGYFYRAFHQNRSQWRRYHVPCSHSSRVSLSYAQQMADEYGEQSNVYRVRVLGDFPLSEDNAVIALGIVEAAVDRDVSPSESGVVWGLDVARFGDDTTALAKRRGNVLLETVKEWKKLDLMQTVGRVVKEYHETPLEARPGAINVDVIGLGAGVVDRLHELGLPVRGVNVGEAPASEDGRFMRLRDELWFKARDWFHSRDCCMPRDDALIDELVGPTYKIESSGKIKVESKDDMKKRGIKSPNKADAFCLTLAGGDYANHIRRHEVAVTNYDPFSVGTDDYEMHVRGLGRRQAIASGVTDYDPFR